MLISFECKCEIFKTSYDVYVFVQNNEKQNISSKTIIENDFSVDMLLEELSQLLEKFVFQF